MVPRSFPAAPCMALAPGQAERETGEAMQGSGPALAAASGQLQAARPPARALQVNYTQRTAPPDPGASVASVVRSSDAATAATAAAAPSPETTPSNRRSALRCVLRLAFAEGGRMDAPTSAGCGWTLPWR